MEFLDARITCSGFTLCGIAAYSFFSIGGNLARGWRAWQTGRAARVPLRRN